VEPRLAGSGRVDRVGPGESVCERERARVYVYVCMSVREKEREKVCVCVRQRERERDLKGAEVESRLAGGGRVDRVAPSVRYLLRQTPANPHMSCRRRAKSAQIRQSRPDSGLGLSHFLVRQYKSCKLFPSRSAAVETLSLQSGRTGGDRVDRVAPSVRYLLRQTPACAHSRPFIRIMVHLFPFWSIYSRPRPFISHSCPFISWNRGLQEVVGLTAQLQAYAICFARLLRMTALLNKIVKANKPVKTVK